MTKPQRNLLIALRFCFGTFDTKSLHDSNRGTLHSDFAIFCAAELGFVARSILTSQFFQFAVNEKGD